MVVHHLVTIALLYFSWCCNFVRIGTLVLVVHDAVDYWMAVSQRERGAETREGSKKERQIDRSKRQYDFKTDRKTDLREKETDRSKRDRQTE